MVTRHAQALKIGTSVHGKTPVANNILRDYRASPGTLCSWYIMFLVVAVNSPFSFWCMINRVVDSI
jgi:hypothetical protein